MPAADTAQGLGTPRDLARRFEALTSAPHIALAVSGGSDSLALLHLVQDWRVTLGSEAPEVSVLTVDHRLREGSGDEAEAVAAACAALDMRHETLAWRGDKPEAGLPEKAREARYGLMTDWCVAHGATHLGVAHTQDDQAETVIMRLARGSGLDGLSGMAPVSLRAGISLVRPLLDLQRHALRDYLGARGVMWIDDPSNEDPQFERIRVRKAAPELSALGLSTDSLALTAARLRRVRAAIDDAVARAMATCVEVDPAGVFAILRTPWLDQPEEIRLRLLSGCLRAGGGSDTHLSAAGLERTAGTLSEDEGWKGTFGGCHIVSGGGEIILVREAGRMSRSGDAVVPGTSQLWDGRFRVKVDCSGTSAAPDGKFCVRALMDDGWAEVRKSGLSCPKTYREGLVSLWHLDRLIAVPHLGYRDADANTHVKFSADFCNFPLVEGAKVVDRLGAI